MEGVVLIEKASLAGSGGIKDSRIECILYWNERAEGHRS